MTAPDIITLIGGTFWLVILMTRQQAAIRNGVIRSHPNQKANP
jgi:hypothetical protein